MYGIMHIANNKRNKIMRYKSAVDMAGYAYDYIKQVYKNCDDNNLAPIWIEKLNQFVDAIVITGIATIFSLVYLFRMFKYTAKLTWVAILMILIYAVLLVIIYMNTQKYEKRICREKKPKKGQICF